MWKYNVQFLPILFLCCQAVPMPTVSGHDDDGSRALFVSGARNDHPAFMVRVDVDRADRTYRAGDPVRFTVKSEKNGYLYLLNWRVDGKVSCLFPNRYQTDNRIAAERGVQVPAAGATFSIDVGAPFSNDKLEVVKAIVTQEPLKTLKMEELIKDFGVEVPESTYKALYVNELGARPASSWGEHHVEIRTVDRDYKLHERAPRRVALVIGIKNYMDSKIRDLKVCDQDAIRLAKELRDSCRFDEVLLLIDEDATFASVEQAFREELVRKTRSGDTVVIYWSGHGGRCADDNGDEKDGYDEFLVVHDGKYTDIHSIRKTMLMDDTLGRWIQGLDGRRVAMILDTCHSGGQSVAAKALGELQSYSKGLAGPASDDAEFDFLDGELTRAKDIGQEDAVVLASSTASQISFERIEGDLSVMTYFLVELLHTSTGTVDLDDAHRYLRKHVAAYVEKNFPGTTQTPLIIPRSLNQLSLRP